MCPMFLCVGCAIMFCNCAEVVVILNICCFVSEWCFICAWGGWVVAIVWGGWVLRDFVGVVSYLVVFF